MNSTLVVMLFILVLVLLIWLYSITKPKYSVQCGFTPTCFHFDNFTVMLIILFLVLVIWLCVSISDKSNLLNSESEKFVTIMDIKSPLTTYDDDCTSNTKFHLNDLPRFDPTYDNLGKSLIRQKSDTQLASNYNNYDLNSQNKLPLSTMAPQPYNYYF